MDRAIETHKVNGYKVSIFQDEDPESPRGWSTIGEMVCWHRRSNLGDRQPESIEREALERGGAKLLARYLKMTHGAKVVLPLYLYEHSGMTIRTTAFSDPWDSGLVGFTFDTPNKVTECLGADATPAEIEAALIGDVEAYDQWLRGDVYGYVIETPDGEHVNSCWGFYGFDYCKAEALEIAKGLKPVTRRRVHLGPNRTLTAHFGATA